ncbi:phage Gp37/Gp68 family protein [Sphingobium sp. LMA1-1-1.1]|uniref:phage Gp37/Gp68 family protein n=1 Tax=Sphingobium sp. LMA1-1-1.1 TaxID=3135238 RepID=UPI0034158D54
MADGTKIEWTDATVNAINGCSVVSPGCTNCYAMRLAGTRLKHHPSRAGLTTDSKAGPVWNGEVRLNEGQLLQPLRWAKPRRIFWNAHGDMFHPAVSDEWIDRCFAVMALTPQHIHQVLTKRADRMRDYFSSATQFRWISQMKLIAKDFPRPQIVHPTSGGALLQTKDQALENVWLGVSVEDQARADERIPHLLATPAAVRWLSCEPLLGPVRLDRIHETFDDGLAHSWESCLNGKRFDIWGEGENDGHPKVDWVVVGGESGKGARPMLADWARSLRDQCSEAGTPFFFKQWGAYLPCGQLNGDGGLWTNGSDHALLTTKSFAGRYLDGVQHDGMPA